MYTEKWMKKKIKLSERGLTQKNTYHMIPVNWDSRIDKLIYGEKNQNSGYLGMRSGQRRRRNRHKGAFWGDGTILYFYRSLGYIGICIHFVKLSKFY